MHDEAAAEPPPKRSATDPATTVAAVTAGVAVTAGAAVSAGAASAPVVGAVVGSVGAVVGSALRQRKHLSPYLLLDGGAVGPKLHTVAKLVASLPVKPKAAQPKYAAPISHLCRPAFSHMPHRLLTYASPPHLCLSSFSPMHPLLLT